jgi:hypothetical protein
MKIFGFELKRQDTKQDTPSFVPQEQDDGALVVAAGGSMGVYIDLDGTVRTEAELVTKYREMSLNPEVDAAIEEIVNETLSLDEESPIAVNLDDLEKLPERVKKAIRDEFESVIALLNINKYGYETLRRWYIDGRLYYHVLIDINNPREGIKELRYIDPRKVRKIREVGKRRVPGSMEGGDAMIPKTQNEYYIYNDKGFNYGNKAVGPSTTGLKIAKDSIIHVTSGLTDTNGTMVLSYLHKAIRSLNQLRSIEDSLVIYRLVRAPERRIWYIDVGNLPKIKAEQYVRDIMIKHKNRLNYDAGSGEVVDQRKFMCYALDTKIPLLDGRVLELNQIIKEYNEGKKLWVYACDPETGKFYPGPVSWAGITKQNAKVVRVTFDNGKSVVCTPDHKFPVWGQGFIEAQHLTPEHSIIPGYRRTKGIFSNSKYTYEQIYKNDTKKWEYTHREVAAWKKTVGLHEELVFDMESIDDPKTVIHHVDHNGWNNNPDNLVFMNFEDHLLFHKSVRNVLYPDTMVNIVRNMIENARGSEDIKTAINSNAELLREWRDYNGDKRNRITAGTKSTFIHKDLVNICKLLGYKTWRHAQRANEKIVRTASGNARRGQYARGSDEWKQLLSLSREGIEPTCKTWKITTPNGEVEIVENLSKYCETVGLNRSNIKGKFGSKGYRAEQLRNHRIISVEWLEDKIDVGSMSIDADETYHSHHTYLLDAGVYTKNTMLEDYWLPRREGGRGTEVTTLPGGQTLGQIDDLLYFQKKLYQTLNVPVNRLNSDALFSIGRATEVTRDELKFYKFIVRLRSKFSSLFLQVLEKQLVLKGVMSFEEWQTIANKVKFDFAKDNYFTELKDAEIIQNRLNLMMTTEQGGLLGKYYSHNWARRNILRQTDQDIEEQDEQIAEEQNDPRWAPQDAGAAPEPDQTDDQQDTGDGDGNDAEDAKVEQLRQAAVVKKRMEEKGPKSRTPQEDSEYRSALQLLTKNKPLLDQYKISA